MVRAVDMLGASFRFLHIERGVHLLCGPHVQKYAIGFLTGLGWVGVMCSEFKILKFNSYHFHH